MFSYHLILANTIQFAENRPFVFNFVFNYQMKTHKRELKTDIVFS